MAGSRADPRPTGQLRVASGGFASRRPRGRAPTRGAAPSTRLAAARPETLEQEVQDEVVEAAPSLKELAAALDDAVAKYGRELAFFSSSPCLLSRVPARPPSCSTTMPVGTSR